MISITKEEVSSLMEIADKNGDGSVAEIIFLVLSFRNCLGDKKSQKQKGELTCFIIIWTGSQNYKIMDK
jgi:hypothetical protein